MRRQLTGGDPFPTPLPTYDRVKQTEDETDLNKMLLVVAKTLYFLFFRYSLCLLFSLAKQ